MDTEARIGKCHVLALPLPFQGHISPMLQFCKRLASKGIKITFLIGSPDTFVQIESNLIKIESLPDEVLDMGDVKASILKHLPDVLGSKVTSPEPVNILVCDSLIPWAIDVAHQLGIPGAALFTQSAAVSAVYYHLYKGTFKIPLEGPVLSLPSLPPLQRDDLPTYINHTGSDPCTLRTLLPFLPSDFTCDTGLDSLLLKGTLEMNLNFQNADWLLFNTYDSLEKEVFSWMKRQHPIKTIGPCLPSIYLDKRLKDDKDYGLSLFRPNAEHFKNWLDSKANSTVVYASFGSLASVSEEQMAEAAEGLANSNYPFLWIVRKSEQNKLPTNFHSETQERGLIIDWCPQLEVLAHPAVGCFMSHCGWNSTLEALSLGVPMLAIPQWTDQPTNAKFIADIWETGVRAKANEKGIVTKEEIEICLKQVFQGESAEKFKKNATRLRELAKEATSEGGSSDKNIEELVSSFLCA